MTGRTTLDFFCWSRRVKASARGKDLEDFAGVFDAQHAGGAVPRSQFSGAEGYQSGEDRIASAAREAWEYLFYLDLLGRSDEENVRNALGHLAEVADF
jgi:hypothetical protein